MKSKLLPIIAAACLLTSILSAVGRGQEATNKQHLREVAITFDDLPVTHADFETMKYVTTNLPRSIKANNVPAIGFVNENKLLVNGELEAQRTALLRAWLDAGLELGNHTFSHI